MGEKLELYEEWKRVSHDALVWILDQRCGIAPYSDAVSYLEYDYSKALEEALIREAFSSGGTTFPLILEALSPTRIGAVVDYVLDKRYSPIWRAEALAALMDSTVGTAYRNELLGAMEDLAPYMSSLDWVKVARGLATYYGNDDVTYVYRLCSQFMLDTPDVRAWFAIALIRGASLVDESLKLLSSRSVMLRALQLARQHYSTMRYAPRSWVKQLALEYENDPVVLGNLLDSLRGDVLAEEKVLQWARGLKDWRNLGHDDASAIVALMRQSMEYADMVGELILERGMPKHRSFQVACGFYIGDPRLIPMMTSPYAAMVALWASDSNDQGDFEAVRAVLETAPDPEVVYALEHADSKLVSSLDLLIEEAGLRLEERGDAFWPRVRLARTLAYNAAIDMDTRLARGLVDLLNDPGVLVRASIAKVEFQEA